MSADVKKQSVTNILSKGGFIKCSRIIGQRISPEASILIGTIGSFYDNYEKQDELEEVDGLPCFYKKSEELQGYACLSRRKFDRAILELKELGVLTVICKRNQCPTNYFYINKERLSEIMSDLFFHVSNNSKARKKNGVDVDEVIEKASIPKTSAGKILADIYCFEDDENE